MAVALTFQKIFSRAQKMWQGNILWPTDAALQHAIAYALLLQRILGRNFVYKMTVALTLEGIFS